MTYSTSTSPKVRGAATGKEETISRAHCPSVNSQTMLLRLAKGVSEIPELMKRHLRPDASYRNRTGPWNVLSLEGASNRQNSV